MKKVILAVFLLTTFTLFAPFVIQSSFADVCIPTDPDFDPLDCANRGGVVGTPIGVGGGPGGAGNVPIDGGLSLMLAASGAAGAHRIWKNRKQKSDNKEA